MHAGAESESTIVWRHKPVPPTLQLLLLLLLFEPPTNLPSSCHALWAMPQIHSPRIINSCRFDWGRDVSKVPALHITQSALHRFHRFDATTDKITEKEGE